HEDCCSPGCSTPESANSLFPDHKSPTADSGATSRKFVVIGTSNSGNEHSTRICGLPPLSGIFFSLCGLGPSTSQSTNNKRNSKDTTGPCEKDSVRIPDRNKLLKRNTSAIKSRILNGVLKRLSRNSIPATVKSEISKTRYDEPNIHRSIHQAITAGPSILVTSGDRESTPSQVSKAQFTRETSDKELLTESVQFSKSNTIHDNSKGGLPKLLRKTAPLKDKSASVLTPQPNRCNTAESTMQDCTRYSGPKQASIDPQSQTRPCDSGEGKDGLENLSEVQSFASIALASLDLSPRDWRVSSISSLPAMDNSHAHPRRSSLQLILKPTWSAMSLEEENSGRRSSGESEINQNKSRTSSTAPVIVAKVSYELSHPQPSRAAAARLLQATVRTKVASIDETEKQKYRKDKLSRENSALGHWLLPTGPYVDPQLNDFNINETSLSGSDTVHPPSSVLQAAEGNENGILLITVVSQSSSVCL
ncbi:hypothetical protein BD289DRAFT_491453, partial [Coniella lustricola]